MEQGTIPPPLLVTLDPINVCNLSCQWCNSQDQMALSQSKYDNETISELPEFLKDWGVKAVCIAGGGEPLLHTGVSDLIAGLHEHGIGVGVVTNGTHIDRHQFALGLCKWVGVSVDAGDPETYSVLKGRDKFGHVIEQICGLREQWPDLEITYKFLIHPENIHSIISAIHKADKLGCNYFHARPAGSIWSDVQNGNGRIFSDKQIINAKLAFEFAKLECIVRDGFIHATLDKFGDDWKRQHNFERCRAMGMTCVIQPDKTVSLCCDRRGDVATELVRWQHLSDIRRVWGTGAHMETISNVRLEDCPRCTYAPHNELYEAFTDPQDKVCKWFI
jgi:MoaA/NifB/PqqE/SkfB family radical SAM enzyme